MIVLKVIFEKGNWIPERELTDEERKKVVSQLINGATNEITYFEHGEYQTVIQPEVIDIVPNWKLRAILKTMGIHETIESEINKLPEPQKTIALAAWEYSPTVNMYSPTVKFIQMACSLSDEEVKTIFKTANELDI